MRTILFYRHYFHAFYNQLPKEVQRKFDWTLQMIASVERVPVKFFKHMEGSDALYEVRVEVGTNIYRCFAFFDEGSLVIIANAFQKKSQKTPKNEIVLAKKIKNQYFHEKETK